MNGNDIDRTLAAWFESDALAAVPADGVERALEQARGRTPRPAWLAGPGSHWGWSATPVGSRGDHLVLPRLRVGWSTLLILVALLGILMGGAIVAGALLLESPSPPPAGLGLLAYAAEGDIYVAEGDGRNPVRVADGLPGGMSGCGSAGYWAEGPMWSPDNRFLAYRSPRSQVQCDRPEADTLPTVLISDPAGHVVAEFPGVGWRVAWSPDSTRVATWLDLYPATRIGVYGLDGRRQTVLSLPPSVADRIPGDYDPVWSPDGESLLVPIRKAVDARGTEVREVWEIPVDGRPARPLPADDPRSHWQSARSPDGRLIAFLSDGKLIVAGIDGSQPRELAPDVPDWWHNDPVWSPTGDRIAVGAGGEEIPSELRVIDVATGSVSTPVPAGGGDEVRVISFSPDGDRILFSRAGDGGGATSLWSVGADGSGLQQLVSSPDPRGITNGDWQTVPTDPTRGGDLAPRWRAQPAWLERASGPMPLSYV